MGIAKFEGIRCTWSSVFNGERWGRSKILEKRNRKRGGPWTKRSSEQRVDERIMRRANRNWARFLAQARNLFTPENYNGASGTREFVLLFG